MNKDWKYPPYDEMELLALCNKSKGSDFYFGVGEDRRGGTFVVVTPKMAYDNYADLYSHALPIEPLLPEGLTKFNTKTDEWEEYNVWTSSKTLAELHADFKAKGFVPHHEIHKFIQLWYFKPNLQSDMDFGEFQNLIKQTTENLKRMRAAQEYMKWQFGTPFYYEEFLSEMNETIEGWVSSHC